MTEGEPELRILLIDDDPMVCRVVQGALEVWYGPGVVVAHDGDAAMAALHEGTYDLVLTDMKMPGPNGIEVARACRELQPGAVVVVMTGYALEEDEVDIAEAGARLLHKPFDARELRTMLHGALEARRSSAR